MADFNSTSPDFEYQVNNNETPTHYERKLDSFPKISKESGKVIIDTSNNIATILIKAEAKKESDKLSESFKLEFIKKLKELPDYEGSKVQEAIEKQTIEIKKIPNREGYAIFESKVGNLVYITKLDGNPYTNIDYFRKKPFFEDGIKAGYLRQGYTKIELNNGLWKLFSKDGKEIPIFSDEYSTVTLNAINTMWDIYYALQNEIKKRKIN